ncbi:MULTISPECIES: hypothetical protein [unclassified Synechococcus]|nr:MULTISPECIES: hypothetical protein [unclassified Synechococcus]WFN58677.1 hypothetical protein N4320_12900 [Synechococcus sp. CCFWC 502]
MDAILTLSSKGQLVIPARLSAWSRMVCASHPRGQVNPALPSP